MKCGRTDELVEWTVDAILKNPEAIIMVATSSRDEGSEVMARIQRELVDRRDAALIDGWRFGKRCVRTSQGGFVDLYSSIADRPMRGWACDHVFVSDRCTRRVIEAGESLEKS